MKQEAYGPHYSPEDEFHSLDTSAQSYDYTMIDLAKKNPPLSPF